MALRLSEGLGNTARGTRTDVSLHARNSASRSAPLQEQSRYSASAAPAKAFAWRFAPCSLGHQIGFLTTIPSLRSGGPAVTDLLVDSSGRQPACSKRTAASSRRLCGVFVRLDWPALTPALTEIRLFVLLDWLAASCYGTALNWNSRLGRVGAVQFTPTGALSAGAPHS